MVNRKGKRPLQKRIELTNWIVLGALLFFSGAFASASFILGVLAGGLISILNFYGLCQGLRTAFRQLENGDSGKSTVMFKYLLRLVLTGIVLYLVLAKTTADIFGLVIGLSTVVIGIVLSGIVMAIDKTYLEEV